MLGVGVCSLFLSQDETHTNFQFDTKANTTNRIMSISTTSRTMPPSSYPAGPTMNDRRFQDVQEGYSTPTSNTNANSNAAASRPLSPPATPRHMKARIHQLSHLPLEALMMPDLDEDDEEITAPSIHFIKPRPITPLPWEISQSPILSDVTMSTSSSNSKRPRHHRCPVRASLGHRRPSDRRELSPSSVTTLLE